jgi:cytochrome c
VAATSEVSGPVAKRRLALLLPVLVLAGCSEAGNTGMPAAEVAGGVPQRAPALIRQYGCGTCHRIPGVSGAVGHVGPPLDRFGERAYVAGVLANTPPNLVRWIRAPQGVVPGNAMPDMGVTEQDARDIAAYLYTLR